MFGIKRVKKDIHVEGMHCGHCAASVEEAIKALDGVRSVKADPKSGIVNIVSAKAIDEAAVAQAVKNAGFEVK
ncbi:MAG: heavy-metal-associated domain-containing protein [Clostridia bacterium]|nr:heavy-metal-associated domain-containing protein [Clostridia bacterium]